MAALVFLIGGGNLLYGRNSHGAMAQARTRPAQEAQNRAIDEARRQAGRQRARPTERLSLFRDTGVVLRTYRLGEADRIIVFMTEQHGKVRAVAKGVRRTQSKFGARLEPLTHVDLLLWQGRSDLDIVNQVEVIDTFRGRARGPLPPGPGDGPHRGDRPDGPGAPPRPAPLRHAGRRPAGPGRHADTDPTLLAPSFFLKALVLEGAAPVLDACASCGEPDGAVELVAFDLTEGGTLCRRCRRGRPISPAALRCCAASWVATWRRCWPGPGRRGRRGGRAGHRGHGGRTSTAASARCAPPPGSEPGWPAPAFGVYVHVPFCRERCDYCAFATYTDRDHLWSATWRPASPS